MKHAILALVLVGCGSDFSTTGRLVADGGPEVSDGSPSGTGGARSIVHGTGGQAGSSEAGTAGTGGERAAGGQPGTGGAAVGSGGQGGQGHETGGAPGAGGAEAGGAPGTGGAVCASCWCQPHGTSSVCKPTEYVFNCAAPAPDSACRQVTLVLQNRQEFCCPKATY